MAPININLERAIDQANQIDEIADKMITISNSKLSQTIEEISICWKGEAANIFLERACIIQDDIVKDITNIKEIANSLQQIAKKYIESGSLINDIIRKNP